MPPLVSFTDIYLDFEFNGGKDIGRILCHFISLGGMKTIDENSSGSATRISQFVVHYHDLCENVDYINNYATLRKISESKESIIPLSAINFVKVGYMDIESFARSLSIIRRLR